MRRWILFLFSIAIPAALSAQSTATFSPHLTFDAFVSPNTVRIADVAGSPLEDVILGNRSGTAGTIEVLENRGLSLGPIITLQSAAGPIREIAAGDVDGDGDIDIVTANGSVVSILSRTGTAYTRTDKALTGSATSLRITDLNGDGFADIVSGEKALIATSAGAFAASLAMFSPAAWTNRIVLADVNGDGAEDFLSFVGPPGLDSASTNAVVETRPNNGLGQLGAAQWTPYPMPILYWTVNGEVADLDGDGKDDVLSLGVPYIFGVENTPVTMTALGGAGGLTSFTIGAGLGDYVETPSEEKIRIGDTDGDGHADAVVRFSASGPLGSWVRVYCVAMTNDGIGRMVAPKLLETSDMNSVNTSAFTNAGIDLGDLDGDGDADLVRQSFPFQTLFTTTDILLASASTPVTAATAVVVEPASWTDTAPGTYFTIRVRAIDGSGAAVAGTPIVVTFPSGSPLGTGTVTTFAGLDGIAVFDLAAPASPWTGTIDVALPNGPATTVPLTVVVRTATLLGGLGQAADAGDIFFDPVTIEVRDAQGNPEAGVRVVISSLGNALTSLAGNVLYSDAFGRVQTTVAAGTASGGTIHLGLQAAGAATIDVPMFVRFYSASRLILTGSRILTLNYMHEHGPTPFILTVDQPTLVPTTTPYGDLYSSILAPSPALFVADTTGQFGTTDPGLVANPSFQRTYTYSVSLAGFALTTQILGFDPAYYPDIMRAIFMSNPVHVTL